VNQRIDGCVYPTPQAMLADFDLMFANAFEFNQEGSYMCVGVRQDLPCLQLYPYSTTLCFVSRQLTLQATCWPLFPPPPLPHPISAVILVMLQL